ncbi:MAG: transglutaminase-like cysteine peptidase [Candidatus Peribacteraceae bacterium]|nr:transglutaminase-like cysteine peptidase [Candidatus Peribacteraceae bacterium]
MQRLIDKIHKDVHSIFIWQPDKVTFGELERWDRPIKDANGNLHGDCDDFMLECYYQLREAGMDKSQLHLAVCRTEVGQRKRKAHFDHAVLLVDIDDTFLVLDNRSPYVYEIKYSGYDMWLRSNGNILNKWIEM